MAILITGQFKDYNEKLFKVEIDSTFYTGTAIDLSPDSGEYKDGTFGVNPIEITWKDTEDYIKGSEASVTILSEVIKPDLDEFLKIEVPNSELKIYQWNDVGSIFELMWDGYVTPYNFEFTYGENEEVTFTAIDKISYQKEQELTITEGYYSISSILTQVLGSYSSTIAKTFLVNGDSKILTDIEIYILPNSFENNYELLNEAIKAIEGNLYRYGGNNILYRKHEVVDEVVSPWVGEIKKGSGEKIKPSIKEIPLKISGAGISTMEDQIVGFDESLQGAYSSINYNPANPLFPSTVNQLSGLFFVDLAAISGEVDIFEQINYATSVNHNLRFASFLRNQNIPYSPSIWKGDSVVTTNYIKWEKEIFVNEGGNHLGSGETPAPSSFEHFIVDLKSSSFSGRLYSYGETTPPLANGGDNRSLQDIPNASYIALQIEHIDDLGNSSFYTRKTIFGKVDGDGNEIDDYELYYWSARSNVANPTKADPIVTYIAVDDKYERRFLDLGINDNNFNLANQEVQAVIPIKESGVYRFRLFTITTGTHAELLEDMQLAFENQQDNNIAPFIALHSYKMSINSVNTNDSFIARNTNKTSGDVGKEYKIRFSSHPGLGYLNTVTALDNSGDRGFVTFPSGKSLLEEMMEEKLLPYVLNSRRFEGGMYDTDAQSNFPTLDDPIDYDGKKWIIEKFDYNLRQGEQDLFLFAYDKSSTDTIVIEVNTSVDSDGSNSSSTAPSAGSGSGSNYIHPTTHPTSILERNVDGDVEFGNKLKAPDFITKGSDPTIGGGGSSVLTASLSGATTIQLTLTQSDGVADVVSNVFTLPQGFSGDYNDLTNQPDLSDLHNHSNKAVLDQFGEDGSGYPTYNGNKIDTVIAQRDVYDGLDSADNTVSLAATQGTALKALIDNIYNKTTSDARYAYKAGTVGQAFSAGTMTLNGALTGTSATFSGSGAFGGAIESGYALKVHGNTAFNGSQVSFKTSDVEKWNIGWHDTALYFRDENDVNLFRIADYGVGVMGSTESGYALKVHGDQNNTGVVYATDFVTTA